MTGTPLRVGFRRMSLVVFRNRKRADIAVVASVAAAAWMEMARGRSGFLSFKSAVAQDEDVVGMSEWVDPVAAPLSLRIK